MQKPAAAWAAQPRALTGADAPTQHTTIWVRYNGRRQGEFGMRGPVTGTMYKVEGVGAEFEIYTVDANLFRRSGRGRDFSVGIAPPAPAPEPEPEPEPQPEYTAPPVRMAEILDLDDVARGERGQAPQSEPAPSTEQAATPEPIAVQPPPPLVSVESQDYAAPVEVAGPPRLPTPEELADGEPEPAPAELTEVDLTIVQEQTEEHPLKPLDLGRFQAILEAEGWTITSLARADAAELIPYPGIGGVTAEKIVRAAQEHLAGE